MSCSPFTTPGSSKALHSSRLSQQVFEIATHNTSHCIPDTTKHTHSSVVWRSNPCTHGHTLQQNDEGFPSDQRRPVMSTSLTGRLPCWGKWEPRSCPPRSQQQAALRRRRPGDTLNRGDDLFGGALRAESFTFFSLMTFKCFLQPKILLVIKTKCTSRGRCITGKGGVLPVTS